MLEKEINEGDELIALLSNLATLVGQASSSHSADHVRFARRLDDWRSRVEARLLESLGEDPRSRFNYLNHVFRSDLFAPGHRIGASDVAALEGVVALLRHFQERLAPGRRSAKYDWSQPIGSTSPEPDLAQIESKRWEYHEALMRASEADPTEAVDPTRVARPIGLHETHAREFFVSLVRIGPLPRDKFSAEWRALASAVDAEEREMSSKPSTEQLVRLHVFSAPRQRTKKRFGSCHALLRDSGMTRG